MMALRYGEEGGALEVEEQPPAEIVKIKWSKVKSLFVLSPICNNGKKSAQGAIYSKHNKLSSRLT